MKNPSALRFLAPALLAGAASLTLVTVGAEGQAPQSAVQVLLDKAHQLEVRGRMQYAAQVWHQVLLSDPNNTEALGGLARVAKLSGTPDAKNDALNKLRSINPNDPAIARVETMGTQQDNDQLLQQAGRLAQQGQYAQAMDIYRRLYGNNPPPGDLALSYYETEAASESGRPAAIAGFRKLVADNPGDTRYQIALGRILTYNPQTRAEGRRMLAAHPGDPQAVEALRQSLLWDAQNPATAGDIRAYLAQHPDAQLSQILHNEPAVAAGGRRGGAPAPMTAEQRAAAALNATRSAADRAAYAQLNAKHLPQAEAMFTQILHDTPDDPNALAGMGYVRMQQANFAAALNFLVQARSDGSRDPALNGAIATSSFYNTMAQGNTALAASNLPQAEAAYKAALAMRPNDVDALEAVGGTLLREAQYDAAAPYFQRFIKVNANAPHAWRGLFLAQSQGGRNVAALETARQFPQPVRVALVKDPLFLRQLAVAYQATGRDADAQRVLKAALELPVPADAAAIETDTQLQYADLLAQANHLDQAAGLYRLVLAKDQNNVRAWQGLVRVEHANGNDAEALQTLESTPEAVYAQAMQDPGFESTVASIDQSQHRLDAAQDLLEKAIAQQQSAGQKPAVGNEVQLAGIYMARNEPARAYPLYRQILTAQPDNTDAWKGLLSSLHTAGHDREVLAEVQQIPAPVRAKLETDPSYLQTIGAVYNSLGEPREAELFFRRVQEHYASQHAVLPGDIDVQEGWLLYNAGDDTALYRQLLELGSRNDLTDAQRRTVQVQWANFAVRRAGQLSAAGNNAKAVAVLNATAKAFPDNADVTKVLAGGYAQAGQAKQSVALWKAQDPSMFTVGDYRSAVGAALSDNDSKDAETWLRFALNQYPHDPDLLILAAKFEEARGDNARAADYYRASLSNMPPADPGAQLAGELGRPAQTVPQPKPGQSLTALLKPGADDQSLMDQQMVAQPQNQQPYLPSANNYGAAPVPMNGPLTAQPMNYGTGAPASRPASGSKVPLGSVFQPQSEIRVPDVPAEGARGLTLQQASFTGAAVTMQDGVYRGDSRGRLELAANGMLRLTAYRQQAAAQPQAGQSGGTASEGVVYGPYVPLSKTPSGPPVAPPQQAIAPVQQQSTTPAQQPNVQYGPYVPYQPAAAAHPEAGATPQLGATQPAARTMATPVVTDILPTAKYVPNARSNSNTSSHADVNAAAAAAARRRQSQPLTGESRPPADDYSVTPTEAVRYGQNPSGQVAQPSSSTLPAAQTTTYGQYQPIQTGAPNGDSNGQQYPQPGTSTGTVYGPATRARARGARQAAPATALSPLVEAQPAYQGLSYPGVGEPLSGQPYPSLPSTYNLGPAPSDADLMQKRLPSLGGRYGGDLLPPPLVLTPRQQAERDLETLESSYSGWLGGTASARYRSGTSGLDRLTDLEAGVEASVTVNNAVRFTVVPTAVFLNNGNLNNTNFIGATTAPVLGTYPLNAITTVNSQPQSGIGGEIQVSTNRFAAAVGYTPYEFLVQNYTGRILFKPTEHITLYGDRSPVTETELSYAGLRDPGQAGGTVSGPIWGGVVSTGGGIRLDAGDQKAGFYITADGADLSGYHVLENYKFEGSAGAYFLAHTFPQYGRLNIGASLFGMHYEYNELGLTYGLGGYFSPTAYFLASVPITFVGHYKDAFHYSIAGAVGVQTFQEASQVYYPLDRALQSGATNAVFPVNSNTSGNYSINTEGAYRITEHWYGGGFLSANNTNNYNTVTGGFFVRYVFRPQSGNEDYPTGLFPVQGFRPLRIP